MKGVSLGEAPALPTNTIQFLQGANTVDYYKNLELTAVKSLITLAPDELIGPLYPDTGGGVQIYNKGQIRG